MTELAGGELCRPQRPDNQGLEEEVDNECCYARTQEGACEGSGRRLLVDWHLAVSHRLKQHRKLVNLNYTYFGASLPKSFLILGAKNNIFHNIKNVNYMKIHNPISL